MATAKKKVARKAVAVKKKAVKKKAVAVKKKAPAKKAPAKKAAAVKKKAVKKKAAAKSPFGPKFIAEMKVKLTAERSRYFNSANDRQAKATALVEEREPGDVQFDEESGEGDTMEVERDQYLALSNQARQTVHQIDAALDRIEAGTYGVCITSGRPILRARLEAIPWADQRVEYKAGGLGRR